MVGQNPNHFRRCTANSMAKPPMPANAIVEGSGTEAVMARLFKKPLPVVFWSTYVNEEVL
jgi:hypothetical protein